MFHVGTPGVIYYGGQRLHDFKEDRPGVQAYFAMGQRPILVTDDEGYRALRPLLPPDARVIEREPRFMKHGEMLVIGREPSAGIAAQRRPPQGAIAAPLEEARRGGASAGGLQRR